MGVASTTLDEWLREKSFKQHSKLFRNRLVIWHVWARRTDGFHAPTNYHNLDRARLEKLIYTHLGSWIAQQRDDERAGRPGADVRVATAMELKKKLELILAGEPPHDIFVRWKKFSEQPIGWEPDLNDGVRLNIRPWVTAGVLRAKFTVNWKKDRGTDPKPNAGGTTERLNDLRLTRAVKVRARAGG